ncbi:unnamed protein product [Cyclocybe aegerita]|uniref:Uncharacterized protein n=1 Tax=Cyclocybe aegerita TaxID=1973307 RepID=A0A8S0WS98_CYCAE|nr:unnamed protein product [Cyclocybe aegerita]
MRYPAAHPSSGLPAGHAFNNVPYMTYPPELVLVNNPILSNFEAAVKRDFRETRQNLHYPLVFVSKRAAHAAALTSNTPFNENSSTTESGAQFQQGTASYHSQALDPTPPCPHAPLAASAEHLHQGTQQFHQVSKMSSDPSAGVSLRSASGASPVYGVKMSSDPSAGVSLCSSASGASPVHGRIIQANTILQAYVPKDVPSAGVSTHVVAWMLCQFCIVLVQPGSRSTTPSNHLAGLAPQASFLHFIQLEGS